MRAISFDFRYNAAGANNDGDTRAYFRHLGEELPWVTQIVEIANDLFSQTNQKTFEYRALAQESEWSEDWDCHQPQYYSFFPYGSDERHKGYQNRIIR